MSATFCPEFSLHTLAARASGRPPSRLGVGLGWLLLSLPAPFVVRPHCTCCGFRAPSLNLQALRAESALLPAATVLQWQPSGLEILSNRFNARVHNTARVHNARVHNARVYNAVCCCFAAVWGMVRAIPPGAPLGRPPPFPGPRALLLATPALFSAPESPANQGLHHGPTTRTQCQTDASPAPPAPYGTHMRALPAPPCLSVPPPPARQWFFNAWPQLAPLLENRLDEACALPA